MADKPNADKDAATEDGATETPVNEAPTTEAVDGAEVAPEPDPVVAAEPEDETGTTDVVTLHAISHDGEEHAPGTKLSLPHRIARDLVSVGTAIKADAEDLVGRGEAADAARARAQRESGRIA